MSTITSPSRPAPAPTPPIAPLPAQGAAVIVGEQRIAIRDVSWDLYDRLSDAIGEGQHVYVAYDGRDLEIMTTGIRHDNFKEILGWFVKILTSELRDPFPRRRPDDMEATRNRAGAWKPTSATSSQPKNSPPSWRRWHASPTTSPTIPTPTWRSRSISRHPRSTGPAFMRR